jgi:hypothetical protein
VARPDGKRQLGRPRGIRKYNIKVELPEVGCLSIDWIIWLSMETGGRPL